MKSSLKALLLVGTLFSATQALAWSTTTYTCENFEFSIGNYPGMEEGVLTDANGKTIRKSIYSFDFERGAIKFKARNSRQGRIAASTVKCTQVCEHISSVEPVCESL